ncbi:MAG: hypothetical protein R3E39_17765 [Anaerolineae bacterium]
MRNLIYACLVFLVLNQFSSAKLVLGQSEQYDGQPTLSPNGDLIAFVSTRAGSHDVWIMDTKGENVFNLTSGFRDSNEILPRWSPDGHKILFESLKDGVSDIWVATVANGQMVDVTLTIEENTGGAVWSPDGSQIAFVISQGIGNGNIGIMNQDGSNFTRLTEGNNDYFSAAWLPDGEHISFLSYGRESSSLNLVKVSEPTDVRVLVQDIITYAWSPNGDFVAFTTHKDDEIFANEIWLLEPSHSTITNLTGSTKFFGISSLVWSPNGKQILIQSECNGNHDLWKLALVSNEIIGLGDCTNGHNSSTQWSSDGQYILFQSSSNSRTSLWIMNSDGSNPRNLLAADDKTLKFVFR